MNTAPQNFFSDKANGLNASSKLPFLPAGFIGVGVIDAVKGITTRTGDRAFIVELTIESTNDPGKVQVGGRYSWYQSLKEPLTSYPACIGFLYAAMGLDTNRDKVKIDKDVKPQQDKLLNRALSDEQPLAGERVGVQTAEIRTKLGKGLSDEDARKTKGALFTVHTFSVAPPAKAA